MYNIFLYTVRAVYPIDLLDESMSPVGLYNTIYSFTSSFESHLCKNKPLLFLFNVFRLLPALPTRFQYTITRLFFCAVYDAPSRLYAIHHTIYNIGNNNMGKGKGKGQVAGRRGGEQMCATAASSSSAGGSCTERGVARAVDIIIYVFSYSYIYSRAAPTGGGQGWGIGLYRILLLPIVHGA